MSSENLPSLTDEFCQKEFGWTKSQFEVIQRTYFKGLSVDEIKIFGHVCKHTKLDPFLKQIYPVIRGGKMTIQTAIDGYRAIAERTGRYSPGREPTFRYDSNNNPICATAYVKKMTPDGTWHEVAATAYFNEYNPGNGPFWKKMPHTMIAKCAEALALRKAFPAELSGLYTADEMDADRETRVTEMNYDEIVKETITPSPLQTVSQEQLDHLLDALKQVDEECKNNMWKYLETTYNITSKDAVDIPEIAFNPCMRGLQNNIEMQKNKKVA